MSEANSEQDALEQRGAARMLDDLKVIDLTTMIAGPVTARMFSELGADVIHIEPPWGDDGRNSTTPFLGREGVLYAVSNRSKRGIVPGHPHGEGPRSAAAHGRGRRRLHREHAHRRPRSAPASATRISRSSTHASSTSRISGWGREGPLKYEPTYDVIIQAFSTAMRRYDEHGPPRLNGSMVGDTSTPLLAAFGAMAALRERDRTGRGSHVTSSLLQGGAAHDGAAQGGGGGRDGPAARAAAAGRSGRVPDRGRGVDLHLRLEITGSSSASATSRATRIWPTTPRTRRANCARPPRWNSTSCSPPGSSRTGGTS